MFNKIIVEITRGKVFPCIFLLCYSVVLPLAFIQQNPLMIRIAWWMSLALGLIVILHGIVSWIDAYQSKNWPRVKAELKQCLVRYSQSDEVYKPVVKYEFYLKSKKYTGRHIDFSDMYGSKASAEAKVNRVKDRADDLYVYYKPNDPTLNVIEPGIHTIHPIRLVFGIAVTVISILGIVGIIKS